MPALAIRQDLSAAELRRLGRREPDRRAARRHAPLGHRQRARGHVAGRGGAAGRDGAPGAPGRRDPLQRRGGPQGLHDRPRSGRPEALTPGRQAALKAWVLRGPDPERDGVSAWRLADIRDHAERAYGVRYSGWGISRLLKRLGLSRQKTRPRHPQGDPAARAAFKKGARVEARGDRAGPSRRAGPALVPR